MLIVILEGIISTSGFSYEIQKNYYREQINNSEYENLLRLHFKMFR